MLRIGMVVYPGFQTMNLGVVAVLETANFTAPHPLYEIVLLSEAGGLVRSSAGFSVDTQAFDRSKFDTLLVVGDNEATVAPPSLVAFLQKAAKRCRRIGATCTGAFNLAQAGLLDGRKATTHWRFASRLQREYSKINVEQDRIFIIDGPVWTSAGMTACIDLALALVEKDLGPEVARLVAKKMVVYHRRAGGQSQHSNLLAMSAKSDRIQNALTFAQKNLRTKLMVEQLAQAANLSPRQFSRAFHAETGQTPARAVENLRVEAARLMLERSRHSLDVIAVENGFADREQMRGAFVRAFGQPPQTVRRAARFGAEG